MKRQLFPLVVGAAIASLVVLAGPAYANQNQNGSITVTPSVVAPGGSVHISGSVSTDACPTSDQVTVDGAGSLFPPDGSGPSTDRDSNGDFAIDYTVPTTTPDGSYTITLRCGGGNVGVSASLTVTSDPLGAPAAGLGGSAHSSSLLWSRIGAVCLTLAGALFALRRRLTVRVS